MLGRKELMEIRDKAQKESKLCHNPLWIRAYLALADAADHLDAMVARSTEPAE